MTARVGAARLVGIGTGIAGTALVTRPGEIALKASRSGRSPAPAVVRVLGVRYLIQAAAEVLRPTPKVLETSCAADGLHAMSMAAVALAWPSYRKAAGASLLLALTSMAATRACLSRGSQ